MLIKHSLFENVYDGYAYSYPHKLAYRNIEPALSMKDVWENDPKDSLFLYLHIPFCEMRCGFCNLFTIANPNESVVDSYLDTLRLQAVTTRDILGSPSFSRMAVGGGTPTFLEMDQLEKLFSIIENDLKVDPSAIPFSFEMSPKTITPEKLNFLHHKGADRVSMGVQSFLDVETKSLGRPQKNKEVYEALEKIRAVDFKALNLDLIYGAYGQTMDSWMFSLEEAIRYKPEEIYLYPLYVRPLTGLKKREDNKDDIRYELYTHAKTFLLERGYEQVSMRMFRLKSESATGNSLVYCCQEDGMVGLGAGARSYTKNIHYSSEYAVGRKSVNEIIRDYILNKKEDFEKVDYGFILSQAEQKRRYLIKSLLHAEGLDKSRYKELFASELMEDFPQLEELNPMISETEKNIMSLTSGGVDYSDAIGPWLYSEEVKKLIGQVELK